MSTSQTILGIGLIALAWVIVLFVGATISWFVEKRMNKRWEAQQAALKRIHKERKTMPLYHLPDPLSEKDKIQAMIEELEGMIVEAKAAKTGEQESLWKSW